MDQNVPYLSSITNVPGILEKIQQAGVPEVFNRDFLVDLGFASSQDRPMVKVLKFLGMLDPTGKPQTAYRDFTDHTRAKQILATRLRAAYDDLFLSDRQAHGRSAESLKGWFKSKTGAGDAVAKKMASTFRALAQYSDFSAPPEAGQSTVPPEPAISPPPVTQTSSSGVVADAAPLAFVYRLEIHLPDTQNVETYRAIFRALRAELMI